MSKEFELLSELSRLMESEEIEENPSFFEIIKRQYDEDLISRMLAYVLKKDDELCKRLLCRYFNATPSFSVGAISEKKIICEKNMSGSRADILVELVDDAGRHFAIVIENKIYSWEHDEQTQVYYDWMCRSEYRKHKSAYFYLKPEFNFSLPICKHFQIITYKELGGLISAIEDIYVRDFKLLICNKLQNKEVKFMDTKAEKFLLEHYKTIKKMVDEEEAKLTTFKNDFVIGLLDKRDSVTADVIKGIFAYPWGKNSAVNNGELYLEKADRDCVFRFYRYGEDWWYRWVDNNHKKCYYFYCEIKFESDESAENPMSKICYQMTIKKYDTRSSDSLIDNFIKDCSVKHLEFAFNQYYIIEREMFSSAHPILSEEWISELKAKTVDVLNCYIAKMDDLFTQFKEYEKSH